MDLFSGFRICEVDSFHYCIIVLSFASCFVDYLSCENERVFKGFSTIPVVFRFGLFFRVEAVYFAAHRNIVSPNDFFALTLRHKNELL